jgi:hypothetical protein
MPMAHSKTWNLGHQHGTDDAENGRCLKVLRVLQMPRDEYSDGYRKAVAEFIAYVHARWN